VGRRKPANPLATPVWGAPSWTPLNAHDFRRNGATTARFRAGNEPNLAGGQLHHRDRNVTENYNLASSFEAVHRFYEIVERMAEEHA
jgi:hypothetical protein